MNTNENTCYRCLVAIKSEENFQHGLHDKCFKTWFEVTELDDFSALTPQEAETQNIKGAFSAINTSFFHGKFRKYSATLGSHSYILKVQMPEFPELPASEYLCNKIADRLEINVPRYFLINFNHLPTFVTRNFIDKGKLSNLVHIYRYLSESEAETFTCEALMKTIERETGRKSEVEKFLEICLFDSYIGNNDRHGRNLALIEMTDKKVLSPFYDNPSYIGTEIDNFLEADLNPMGTIATATTAPQRSTMKAYKEEIIRLGYPHVIETFQKKCEQNQANILSLVENSLISEKRKKAFTKLLRKRHEDLQSK